MTEEIIVPEEFTKVIKDFVSDIITTFPEYVPIINKWWKSPDTFAYIEDDADRIASIEKAERASIKLLFTFSKKKMPPRFFDILYQNEDMFKEDSEVDTEFLPHIHFKNLWQCDITQKTRDTVWKYLQLILFSIVGSLDNKEAFGDTAKLFDALNQDDFKTKLEETLARMQDLFEMSPKGESESESEGEKEGTTSNLNMEDMPKANDLHDHITGMLDGKLGKLAKEIAEETAESINMDMDNVTDMKDVLNNLIKNPAKLMGLVKNVGDKLDTKLKSGDIKESELIAEATEIMNKMKNMPGMVDIQSMLSKMGLSGLGGLGGKVDVNAMEAQLNRNLKTAQTKERMKAKSEASKLAKERDAAAASNVNNAQMPTISEEEILKIFSTGEAVERTPRGTPPKKSNGKKKKGKK